MDTNNAPEDDKTATKRFLFDVSFDMEEKHASEEEPSEDEPPEPVFTLEQVEDARQQGYREGREAGIADAANGVEIEVRNLLQQIGEMLPGIAAEQTTANELLMRDGAEVAVTIVRKLMPTTIEPQSIKEIEALVSECLERLTHQPKISIRVAEQHVATIEAHLDEAVAAKGFDGRFLVEAEDGLAPTDCRVTWPSGGAERNLDAIWQDIEATLDRFRSAGATGTAATDAQTTEAETQPETAEPNDALAAAPSSRTGDAGEDESVTEPNDQRHTNDGGPNDETDPSA